MLLAARNSCQLTDGMLEEGLSFVASYLEKSINRPIIIADHNGLIHYPCISEHFEQVDELFFCSLSAGVQYFYREDDGFLSYPVEYNGTNAYIIIQHLSKKKLAHTFSVLAESKLAIKCYFSNLYKSDQIKMDFEKELAQYLFLPNDKDLESIIALSNKPLDLHAQYCTAIIEFNTDDTQLAWKQICSFSRDYLIMSQLDVITIVWSKSLVLVLPGPSSDTDINILSKLLDLKKNIECRYHLSSTLGIGQAHELYEIKKSCYEARIALTLPRLMGKAVYVQQFSHLQIFSLLFSLNPSNLEIYCKNTLGKILDYDKTNKGDLLLTLRRLLDNCFSWKATANSLFVHINTLYYRINKIQDLLNIDLSKMETRVNLYLAIKIWDTLVYNDNISKP
ncbi:MAG: helix-turn-helix domain-containing protein [Bacillota bacterium]|nr:helix-turn-helix domain-containing protein [Bacillota bacterium]